MTTSLPIVLPIYTVEPIPIRELSPISTDPAKIAPVAKYDSDF